MSAYVNSWSRFDVLLVGCFRHIHGGAVFFYIKVLLSDKMI